MHLLEPQPSRAPAIQIIQMNIMVFIPANEHNDLHHRHHHMCVWVGECYTISSMDSLLARGGALFAYPPPPPPPPPSLES